MSFSLIQLRLLIGKLVDVELAGGEHDFAGGAVDVVAVDVDVGKVVVGADLLDLAEGVLEGVPVPEADVLEGGLVVGGVGGGDGGFGGELVLVEAVEAEGLAGHLDVVGDVRSFAVELVGLDDEAADVPADEGEHDVADGGGSDGGGDEAAARDADGVDGGEDGSGDEGERDEQQAGEGDVGVGVVDAVEDGVVVEEELEAAEVDVDGEDEEEEGESDGGAAPGGGAVKPVWRLSSARVLVVMTKKTAAAAQMTRARVRSQSMRRSQAGRVKRKKLRGLAKMGSASGAVAAGRTRRARAWASPR